MPELPESEEIEEAGEAEEAKLAHDDADPGESSLEKRLAEQETQESPEQ